MQLKEVDDDRMILFVELAEGDLERLLRDHGRMQEVDVKKNVGEILRILEHIHEDKLSHNDVKAENIFCDGHGAVKIGDLGLGRLLSTHSSHARTGVGTPLYFSPEMCEERPYNAKSDVWALGCITLEIALGIHWFAEVWLVPFTTFVPARVSERFEAALDGEIEDVRKRDGDDVGDWRTRTDGGGERLERARASTRPRRGAARAPRTATRRSARSASWARALAAGRDGASRIRIRRHTTRGEGTMTSSATESKRWSRRA